MGFCKYKESGIYEVPGGYRELCVNVIDTVKRELMEEIGIICTKGARILQGNGV